MPQRGRSALEKCFLPGMPGTPRPPGMLTPEWIAGATSNIWLFSDLPVIRPESMPGAGDYFLQADLSLLIQTDVGGGSMLQTRCRDLSKWDTAGWNINHVCPSRRTRNSSALIGYQ